MKYDFSKCIVSSFKLDYDTGRYKHSGYMPFNESGLSAITRVPYADGVDWYKVNQENTHLIYVMCSDTRITKDIGKKTRVFPSDGILAFHDQAVYPAWYIEAVGVTWDNLDLLYEREPVPIDVEYWAGFYKAISTHDRNNYRFNDEAYKQADEEWRTTLQSI